MTGRSPQLEQLAVRIRLAGFHAYWSEPCAGDRQHVVFASLPTGGRSFWIVDDDAGRLVLSTWGGFRYVFTVDDLDRQVDACVRLLGSRESVSNELPLDPGGLGLEPATGPIRICGRELD